MTIDKTLFGIPSDPHRASEVAMRDARRVRDLWRQHGTARRLTDRQELAERASFYEEQVRRVADHFLQLAANSSPASTARAPRPSLHDGPQPSCGMSDGRARAASAENYMEQIL